MKNMKKSKSNTQADRRDFIIKSLAWGALMGISSCGLQKMDIQEDVSNSMQDKHKFQTPINFTYEQLFNFTFRSWFISYMKRLQKEIGSKKFLEFLNIVGDDHYRSRVKSNFKKIENKSVQSFIENFWEPTKKSNFGSAIMTIEIPKKSTNKGIVKMTECLFAKTFRENNAGDIGYASICHADFAVAHEFNPDIKLIRNKCLMNGDECCLFEYLLKS